MRKRTFKLGPPLEGFFTVTCLCILVYLRVDFDHLGIVQTSVKLNPFKILWGLRCNLLALGRVNCRFCIAIIAVFCTLETFRSEALLKAKCKTQCITFGLLICTLISEIEVFRNQGLFQTLEKCQVLQTLIFFRFGTLIFSGLQYKPSFFQGGALEKNQGLQHLKFFQGLKRT